MKFWLHNQCRLNTRAAARRRGGVSLPAVIGIALVPVTLAIWGLAALLSGESAPDRQAEAPRSADGQWYIVERHSFDLKVVSTGELEAKEQVEIKSAVKHDTTIVEVIDEGQFVKKGDLIVRLDADKINKDIDQEELNLEKARSEHIASEQNLEIERNEAESAEKAAEVKLALSQLDLAKWTSGEVPQKKRELQLALEKAERKLERAEREYKLSQELFDEQFISQSELEDDAEEVIDAKDALATAKLNLEVYDAYTYQREQKQKNSDVEQAQAEFERTRRKNQSKLARTEADLASKKRTLKIREDRMAELKDQLDKTEITAPQDGLVVYASSVGRRRWNNEPIVTGKRVFYNESLILLPDTRQMLATLLVHEALVPQVCEGQKATVTIDARPGELLAGVVSQIGVMAEDGGWINPNLREYKVKIELPENVEGLKPAMRCSGEIITGHVEEAIAVPIQAVFTEGDQQFCYVPAGRGRVRRAPVTLGQASESYVEITEGLTEGARVLLRQPRPAEIAD